MKIDENNEISEQVRGVMIHAINLLSNNDPRDKSIDPDATYMLSHQKTIWVCFYHDFYNFFLIQIPENHMGRQVDHLQATIQSQLEGVSEGTVIQTFMYNDSDKILE